MTFFIMTKKDKNSYLQSIKTSLKWLRVLWGAMKKKHLGFYNKGA